MIGLLNAYLYEKEPAHYQLEYGPLILNFLSQTFPNKNIKSYAAGYGELPLDVNECQVWVITGSAKSAYEQDNWIKNLGEFVQACHHAKQKLIGICFGHQLIAHYLGGRTEKSPRGWGVGVRKFQIVQCKPWMKPELKETSLIFSHQDQVVELPSEAELLATDEFCPIQMYSIGNHILSMQGHPEFTPDFAKGRLDERVARIGSATYKAAIPTLNHKTHAKEVGSWIAQFIDSTRAI